MKIPIYYAKSFASLGSCDKMKQLKIYCPPCLSAENETYSLQVNKLHFLNIQNFGRLSRLSIHNSHVSVESFKSLSEQLQVSRSLISLHLSSLFPNCSPGMEPLWKMIGEHTSLKIFKITDTELSELDFSHLGKAIAKSVSLEEVGISPINLSMIDHISIGLEEK